MATPRHRGIRPSGGVVALALVVVAVPTVFTIFPELGTGQRVWWRLIVIAVWGSAAGSIGYRTARREAAADAKDRMAKKAALVRATSQRLGQPEHTVIRSALVAAAGHLPARSALAYYRPAGRDRFTQVAAAGGDTLSQPIDTGAGARALRAAWDRGSAVVVTSRPRQVAAPVNSETGTSFGVVLAIVFDQTATAATLIQSIQRVAEALGVLLADQDE